jgi:hypothetical protein
VLVLVEGGDASSDAPEDGSGAAASGALEDEVPLDDDDVGALADPPVDPLEPLGEGPPPPPTARRYVGTLASPHAAANTSPRIIAHDRSMARQSPDAPRSAHPSSSTLGGPSPDREKPGVDRSFV